MYRLIVLHLVTTLALLGVLALVVLVQTGLKAASRLGDLRPGRRPAELSSGSPRTA